MKKVSKKDCEDWFKNPLKNPLTKRSISKDGPVYKQLQKSCESMSKEKPVKKISSSKDKSPKLGKKKNLKKKDCEEKIHTHKWLVGQGCFELIKEKEIIEKSELPKIKLGAKKYKITKQECKEPLYTWIIGQGCFENMMEEKEEEKPKDITSSYRVINVKNYPKPIQALLQEKSNENNFKVLYEVLKLFDCKDKIVKDKMDIINGFQTYNINRTHDSFLDCYCMLQDVVSKIGMESFNADNLNLLLGNPKFTTVFTNPIFLKEGAYGSIMKFNLYGNSKTSIAFKYLTNLDDIKRAECLHELVIGSCLNAIKCMNVCKIFGGLFCDIKFSNCFTKSDPAVKSNIVYFMEYLRGDQFYDLILKSKTSKDVKLIFETCLFICHLLEDLQTKLGFVHYDLHPGNIYLIPGVINTTCFGLKINLPFIPIILDFGLSVCQWNGTWVTPMYIKNNTPLKYFYNNKPFNSGFDLFYLFHQMASAFSTIAPLTVYYKYIVDCMEKYNNKIENGDRSVSELKSKIADVEKGTKVNIKNWPDWLTQDENVPTRKFKFESLKHVKPSDVALDVIKVIKSL